MQAANTSITSTTSTMTCTPVASLRTPKSRRHALSVTGSFSAADLTNINNETDVWEFNLCLHVLFSFLWISVLLCPVSLTSCQLLWTMHYHYVLVILTLIISCQTYFLCNNRYHNDVKWWLLFYLLHWMSNCLNSIAPILTSWPR